MPSEERRKKILMHIECLRGTGELTMAARVAKAMADKGMDVIVLSGNTRTFFEEYISPTGGGSITLKKLPTITYIEHDPDNKYSNKYLTDENPPRLLSKATDWLQKRADILLEAINSEPPPDAAIICYWPFANGKGILDYEMEKFTKELKDRNIPIALAIRDVIHADSPPYMGNRRSVARFIKERVSAVLVHGVRDLIPLTEEGIDYPAAIGDVIAPQYTGHKNKIQYTGYVCAPHVDDPNQIKDTIVVTAGGGFLRPSSGLVLAKSLKALALLADNDDFMSKMKGVDKMRVFVAQNCPDELRAMLERFARNTGEKLKRHGIAVTVEAALPFEEYQTLLPRCALYMGQAGIATILDIMSYRYPAVLVPIEEASKEVDDRGHRIHYHFDEQFQRAERLAKKQIFAMVREKELGKVDDDEGVDKMVAQIRTIFDSPSNRIALEFLRDDGAVKTADLIESMIREHALDQGITR